MGNTAWQLETNDDELAAIGISKHRGRGTRIVLGVLAIASLTFGLAYYLPLYRSHAALGAEFTALAKQSNERGSQLKQALSALERVTKERDALKKPELAKKNDEHQRGRQLQQFEWQIAPKFERYKNSKAIRLERDAQELRISLHSSSFFSPDRALLSPAGAKAVCTISGSTEMKNQALFEIRALATDVSGLDVAVTLAGSTARLLVDSCGVSARAVRITTTHGDPGSPLLEIALRAQ